MSLHVSTWVASQDKQVKRLKCDGKGDNRSRNKVQWYIMPETSSRKRESRAQQGGEQQVQRQKHRGTFQSKTNIYLLIDSKEKIQAWTKKIYILKYVIMKTFKAKYSLEKGLYEK